MKTNPALWTALALLAILVVCSLFLPPVSRPKRQAQHNQSINAAPRISFTLTNAALNPSSSLKP
jgi:hypothetical protein